MKMRLYWKYFVLLWLFPIPFYIAGRTSTALAQMMVVIFPIVCLVAAIPYFRKQMTAAETLGWQSLFVVVWLAALVVGGFEPW
jgi:hypothetical protein